MGRRWNSRASHLLWKFCKISKTFLGKNSVTLHQRQKCKPHSRAQGCSPTWQSNTPMVAELAADVAVGTWYGVDDSSFALSVPDALLVASNSCLILFLSKSFYRQSPMILRIQIKTLILKFWGENLICSIRSHKGCKCSKLCVRLGDMISRVLTLPQYYSKCFFGGGSILCINI